MPDEEPANLMDPPTPNWREFLRPGWGQIAVAVALGLFAMAIVMQIRVANESEDYRSLRRTELVQVLDGLTQENRRLERDLTDLDRTKDRIVSGSDSQKVAREQATKRLNELRILAGTEPASGPGIVLVISDPQRKLTPELMVDAIQEMRDAGAEVIELNDSVRVVGSSWFGRAVDGSMVVDGQVLTTPVKMDVIGDPHSLEEGARFRGGIVSEITGPRVNGRVTLTPADRIEITAIHQAKPNQYARPTQ